MLAAASADARERVWTTLEPYFARKRFWAAQAALGCLDAAVASVVPGWYARSSGDG